MPNDRYFFHYFKLRFDELKKNDFAKQIHEKHQLSINLVYEKDHYCTR